MDVSAVENQMISTMLSMLKNIYSNRSSDEYKSHGDITKSSEYSTIEKMVSDLSTLKKFSKTEASDLKSLFNTLHRPVFKKMVTEYINEPNDRNTIFTAVYTVGFRVLVGELSRIFSSTVATDNGIEYKPDKVSKKNNMNKLIRYINNDIEKRIDAYIKTNKNTSVPMDEATANVVQEGVGTAIKTGVMFVGKAIPKVLGFVSNTFSAAKELNPVSFINAILSHHYDKKVQKFEDVAALYEATKEAYEEYMKIPQAQRSKKIESKYVKNMEKYNIKMNNIYATIKHYDQRSIEEAPDEPADSSSSTSTKPSDSSNDNNDSDFDF